MPVRTVYYEAAVEYLSDGEWHDLEKTVRRVMDAVPPGKAIQQAERARIAQHRKSHGTTPPPPRRSQYDTEVLIKVGARTIARATLNNRGRFLINEERTKIRLLTPDERKVREGLSRKERSEHGWQTRLRAAGIDPAQHITKAEERRIKQEIKAAWTPEEWKKYHSDNNHKAWETRRARAKEARDRLQGVRGHQGPGGDSQDDRPALDRPGGPGQREGGGDACS